MQAIARQFREVVLGAFEQFAGQDVPLCFSGGVDSCLALAALMEVGARPHPFTFYLEPNMSNDSTSAQMIAKTLGLRFELIMLPRNPTVLERDIRYVLSVIDRPTKVHVQVCQPFVYMCRRMVELGYDFAMMAMSIDDMWGKGREFQITRRKYGEKAFSDYRRKVMEDPDQSDWSVVKMCAHEGIRMIDPFRTPALVEFMLGLTHNDMHGRMDKGIAVYAFPEFWSRGAFYRGNGPSLQVDSGIREWHDTLLQSPLNIRNSKAVVAIYTDMWKGRV